MKIIAARNFPSLQKAMIEVKKSKDILTVTLIDSKIPNLQNQGFINKKLSKKMLCTS